MKTIKESIIGRRGATRNLPKLTNWCTGDFGYTVHDGCIWYRFVVDISKQYTHLNWIQFKIELRNLLRIDLPVDRADPGRAMFDYGSDPQYGAPHKLEMCGHDVKVKLTVREKQKSNVSYCVIKDLWSYAGMESAMHDLVAANELIPYVNGVYKDVVFQFGFSSRSKKLEEIDINVEL